MGLDITAYRKLTPAPDAAREDGCIIDWKNFADFDQSSLDWTDKHWPGHRGGVTAGAYSFEKAHRFRAGSYSGYGWWRDQLARMAFGKPAEEVWKAPAAGPFSELIHFADNEGVIAGKVAAKLAADFAEHQDRAEEFAKTIPDGDWWLQNYGHWRKAFEMAADGAAVDFH